MYMLQYGWYQIRKMILAPNPLSSCLQKAPKHAVAECMLWIRKLNIKQRSFANLICQVQTQMTHCYCKIVNLNTLNSVTEQLHLKYTKIYTFVSLRLIFFQFPIPNPPAYYTCAHKFPFISYLIRYIKRRGLHWLWLVIHILIIMHLKIFIIITSLQAYHHMHPYYLD